MPNSDLSNVKMGLFPDWKSEESQPRTTGVLPSQSIRELVAHGRILARPPVSEDQIQPASLDLRLGDMGYRIQASFLPGESTVEERAKQLRMARVDLTRPTLFEKGCVYIVPLVEELSLPADIAAKANPKSTTGRLDIFTRLIVDYGVEFDRVPAGYKGRLYAEIVPGTFTVDVRAGMKLNQLRFVRGNPPSSDSVLSMLDEEGKLVFAGEESPGRAKIDRGLKFTLNLQASGDPTEIIAYKARRNTPAIDLAKINHYSPEDFWEIRRQPPSKSLILDPGDFYILASRERVRVPPDFAAEMVPFDASIGEFRIHYAGFFDPGFGYGTSNIEGTQAVLEVRAHEVPFMVEHGQVVGRLTYMHLLARPDKIYGADIGSSYQQQALALSKQFQR
ncbi:MAG TPA: 2'-deoxycytidine 5'-triphosphate deaminase [Terriglobales bacterium]|jgi:dCTP deaminase|nr:2'-deoxycytidine 5'-triphosphate deaminase [Terriglobales bacterium]